MRFSPAPILIFRICFATIKKVVASLIEHANGYVDTGKVVRVMVDVEVSAKFVSTEVQAVKIKIRSLYHLPPSLQTISIKYLRPLP